MPAATTLIAGASFLLGAGATAHQVRTSRIATKKAERAADEQFAKQRNLEQGLRDKETQDTAAKAADEARRRQRAQASYGGRSSMIRTSPLGVPGQLGASPRNLSLGAA